MYVCMYVYIRMYVCMFVVSVHLSIMNKTTNNTDTNPFLPHNITTRTGIPCAHAPAFDMRTAGYEPYPNTAPKACAGKRGYFSRWLGHNCTLSDSVQSPVLVLSSTLFSVPNHYYNIP